MSVDDVIEIGSGPSDRGPGRRRLGVALVVAVLAVAAALLGWQATRGGSAGAGWAGPACPANAPASVPARPTASGLDGRLVPTRAPSSVVLCEYPGAVVGVTVAVPGDVGVATAVPPGGIASDSAAVSSADTGTSAVGTATAAVGTVTAPATAPVPEATDLPTGSSADPTALPLGRSASLAGDDPALASLLTGLRQTTASAGANTVACATFDAVPLDVGAGATGMLVGLGYDDGTVWVAGLNGCALTNGETVGVGDLAALAADAWGDGGTDGVTVAPVPPDASLSVDPSSAAVQPEPGTEPGIATAEPGTTTGDPGTGQVGTGSGDVDPNGDVLATCAGNAVTPSAPPSDATPLVPFTPTAVRVCHLPVTGDATASDQPPDVAVTLADVINALPELAPDTACTAIGSDSWLLLFTDRAGAQQSVTVDRGGCGTASDGLQTRTADDDLFTRLDALG